MKRKEKIIRLLLLGPGGCGKSTILKQLIILHTEGFSMFEMQEKSGVSNWWMVIFLFGGIFGGAFSALLSGTWGKVPGVSIPFAFCGGFLLLFGARLAAGCTSGHGLSGSGFLSLASFIAIPCIFAGATPAGDVYQQLLFLK